jgi:hypothetical protein
VDPFNFLSAILGGESMHFHKYSPMICITICMLFLSACIIKDSPAPGCVESIGFPAMGGCSGKTAIVDLEVTSAPDCVIITVNNCNGGVLNIRNTCTEALTLNGIVIDPSDSISLDAKMVDGSIELTNAHGNFTDYVPDEDTRFELEGVMGTDPIQITFTKTKLLCK